MRKKGITLPFEKENCIYIPESPGVYIFKDSKESVIYIGKAVNLRKRVQSYHRDPSTQPPKVQLISSRAATMEFIVCSTEKEALILEDSLIKEKRPRYNVRLRDDKAYPFIRIGLDHEYPRIHLVRKRKDDGASYFGPYTSSEAARSTLRFVAKTFGLRTCPDTVLKTQKRPCLRAQINLCLAPCDEDINKELYKKSVNDALAFLGGRKRDLIERLRCQMEEASQALDFEKAARLRDQIKAIEVAIEPQDVVLSKPLDLDCIGLAADTTVGRALVVMLKVREGRIVGRDQFEFDVIEGEEEGEILRAFLKEKYQCLGTKMIILPLELKDKSLMEEFLKTKSSLPIKLIHPKRGEKKKLLSLARENAEVALATVLKNIYEWNNIQKALKNRLDLDFEPSWIECIDVSHTVGRDRVGSLVCFKDGEPLKAYYRQYNLCPSKGADDYAGIREIIKRRIERVKKEGRGPDLIIIDGGKGQLNAACEELSLKTPDIGDTLVPFLIAIAKERDGSVDKIYTKGHGTPLLLRKDDPVLLFIQKIRDEAHRFGITAHRKKRLKAIRFSVLEEIPGVGARRKEKLLKEFGSLGGIKNATIEELRKVPGITYNIAKQIKEKLET